MIPKTPQDLMWLAEHDPKEIIESLFLVQTKEREIVPFIFNDLQNEFYYQRTWRDDILKAGQIGFSTMILAIFTVKFLLVPRSWGVSLSYESEATERLFSKVEFWLDPRYLDPILKPFLSLSVDKIGSKVNKVMSSRLYIGTAGAHAFGRGDTIHYAHFSETSRWKDAGRVATGILRAVPLTKQVDTWIVGETTANGIGNYHHTEWVREVNHESEFNPYFALWLKHDEYQLPGDPIEVYDESELELKKLYPDLVTDAKLRWRRMMIRTLKSEDGRSPEDMFKQEFPSTWQEAFLFSGHPVFPTKRLNDMLSNKRKPIKIGSIVGLSPNQTFMDDEKGPVKVFKMPVPGRQYLIFGDVGQKHDRCVATVLDKETAEVVAKYKEVINARTFGKDIQKLGFFYNKAMIAVECNNMGQSTMDQMIEDSYPNIYMRQELDTKTKEVKDVPGWWTTEQSKGQIVGNMQNLIIENLQIPDEDIVTEMMTYVRDKTGKMGAIEGAYDDCVISVCGAYYILRLHPFVAISEKTTRQESPADRYRRMRSARLRR